MVHLTIDGISTSVPKGTMVYHAIRQLGIEVPIFCYQDRMPPFGACRVCLVEVEKMSKLQTSCTLEAAEGMVIKTQSSLAVDGRKEILEFLLINHPLDCPICDRGGECPLQDQALKFGPGESRFYEEKRHFKKALSLGPVLKLDRERCIVCARCTRFGDTIAGDHALEFIERGYKTEVGTPDGKPAESKFIGNTIMICPVGALTSEVYRFRARPWDNKPTDTTCTLCPVGCSMVIDSRDGEIMRTRSRENKDVNDIWLCDKGWFGYEFAADPERLRQPLIRRGGKLEAASWDEALTLIASKIEEAKPSGKLAALGGNPLTFEENYLFQKMMREAAGVNHIDHRIGMPIHELSEEGLPAGMEMTIGECEELSYAVLLGVDLTEEFPVIWLRLKQAINRGAKVIFMGHYAPEIAPHLEKVILHAPGTELQTLSNQLPYITELTRKGYKGAIFVGTQYLNSPNRLGILSEMLKLQQSATDLSLNILEGQDNSVGARWAGMRPDRGPFNTPISKPGLNSVQLIEEASKNGWKFLYVAGSDPAMHFPSKLWIEARSKIDFMVVQDLFLTKTARNANVILPALSYVEKDGSFINIEGRIQALQQGKDIPADCYSDAQIFSLLAGKLNTSLLPDPALEEFLKQGRVQLQRPGKIEQPANKEGSHPSSNTLAATFSYALFDHGVRMKHNPHVIQLSKEPRARIHPADGLKLGLVDDANVSISINGNAVAGKVQMDKRVSEGTVVLPLGFEQLPLHELGVKLMNGMAVAIART